MQRRSFIQNMATAAMGLSFSPSIVFGAEEKSATGIFIGTPVLPEYLYENGIAQVLDTMQRRAGIKTVMTFSHDHVFRQYRPDFAPKTDKEGNALTNVWVKTHAEYYDDPRFQGKDFSAKYADRDVLDDLWAEAEPRGMQVYARILEPYVITGAIPGFEMFAEIDAFGKKRNHVCFNHPGYILYWESVIADLIRSHPYLHGFKFGQERGGPLLTALGGTSAMCFCEHCQKIAGEREINIKKARDGMIALQRFGERIRNESFKPNDGFFVALMRLIAEYPDVLSWEKLWMDSREEQKKRMYKQIKSINPKVQVGWHIDHGMTWDLITRTFWDYSQMGPYSDWLSTAVYFDSMGRRSMKHYNKFYRNMIFGDASEALSYPMYLSMLGYDPAKEAELIEHEIKDTAFSAEYVYAECKRAVKAVNGAAKVYARPGFDMPGYECNVAPDQVHRAVTRAIDAGVDGLWCGREWDELKPENAEAFGRAVREYIKKEN